MSKALGFLIFLCASLTGDCKAVNLFSYLLRIMKPVFVGPLSQFGGAESIPLAHVSCFHSFEEPAGALRRRTMCE